MSSEFVYKISVNHKACKYFQISGPNSEKYNFYRKNWKKCRLIRGEAQDAVKIANGSIFSTILSLNCVNFDSLEGLMFFPISRSGYKVITDHWSKIRIDWTWKPCKIFPKSLALVDESREQVLAQMEGFTLEGRKIGTLFISEDVPDELRTTIVTTACLIWKLKQDTSDRKLV